MIGALARAAAVPAMDRRVRLLAGLLPLWFLGWSLIRVQQLGWTGGAWDLTFLGRDFWIYRGAGLAVLDGTDPWLVSSAWNGIDWHFAAPPLAAQLFVPFALLPASAGLVLFSVLSVGAAWAGLRALGLPAWWLLFPPMTEGILAANPQVLLLGLLLVAMRGRDGRIVIARPAPAFAGWLAARAAAVGLKIYGIVPIVARREWSAVLACAGLIAASIALGPSLWVRYISDFGEISRRIVSESGGGLSAAVFLKPGVFADFLPDDAVALALGVAIYALLALIVVVAAMRDTAAAGWIAVPLLWPAAEYHLATMAIPAARRAAIWLIAVPSLPFYLLGLIVLAWQVAAGHPPVTTRREEVGLKVWLRDLRAGGVRRAAPDG